MTSSPGPRSPEGARTSTVIANPPYIPAPDGDILMPELWGGWYGNDLVLRLLKAGFDHLLVALPSYSDPACDDCDGPWATAWPTSWRSGWDLGYYS